MAQKRISRARKRDLEKPDEFITLTARFLNALGAYWKPISIGFGLLLTILAGALAFGYFNEKAEYRAAFFLTQAMDRYAVELNSRDAAKALDAVSPDFEKLFSEFGNRQAGVAGRLIFANMNYRAGRMAPAVEQYEAALGQFPEGTFKASAAWSGMGYAQAGAGEHEKAIAAFSKTVAGADPVLKADALYQMALLYRKMGEEGQYRKTLETLKNNYPESIYADILPSATAGS